MTHSTDYALCMVVSMTYPRNCGILRGMVQISLTDSQVQALIDHLIPSTEVVRVKPSEFSTEDSLIRRWARTKGKNILLEHGEELNVNGRVKDSIRKLYWEHHEDHN